MDEKKRTSKIEYKKLKKREKTLLIANAAALTVVFAAIALFMTFGKRPNVSFEENRDLEKPPVFTWADYWDGKVTEQFGKYYNDTVPMRTTWKVFIANFRSCLGVKYDGGVTIIGPPVIIEEPPVNDTSLPANSIPAVVIPGQSNSIPAVVIPKPENSIPAVVIPKPENSIPAVVIPGQESSSEALGDTTPMPDEGARENE